MWRLTPLKIVLAYVLFSVVWITSSDLLIEKLTSDARVITVLSLVKGWLFVAVTATLLYGLVRRYAAEGTEAERSLRESERKSRFVIEHANDGILIAQDGMLRFVNPRMASITGYTEEELTSRPFGEFLHPDDRAVVLERHLQRMQGLLDPEFTYTFRLLRKDGGVVWIETRGASSIWDGRPATINFLSDISDRIQADEERFRSEKLRSVGVLAGGIAHDFNNILTAIVANISYVRSGLPRESMQAERLAEAEKAAFRARDLTKQLLTFSRGGSPVRRPVDPAAIIRESAKLALLGRGTACDLRVAGDLWNVEADEGQIGQVINNLVINASHAMAGGGTVVITAENREVRSGEQPLLADGRYVAIAVSDRGGGIPAEHRSRIFDPYFTTKQEGSGLGLAVSYSIVKSHGGTITVDSEPGNGAVFTVYLPATDRPAAAACAAEPAMVRGSGRVLVMDDEDMVRDVAGAILAELGYEVGFARDGEEAVAVYLQAQKDGRPYDAVIMDLTVPGGMNGRDATRELLARDPAARVIVSSGYHQDPIMAHFRDHGFRDCIAKPYDVSVLSRTLARVLA